MSKFVVEKPQKKRWGRYILYVLAGVLLAALVYAYYKSEWYIGDVNAGTLTVGDTTIVVEVANDHAERQLGLSNRDFLKQDSGMWFVFPESDIYPFWMKDMKFSLDIIWVDKFMKVIGVTENLSPDSYPQEFKPKEKVLYVLEVNAGFVKEHKVEIGSEVKFVEH